MGKFFNDRSGGHRGGGRPEKPTMHKAVCDECGQECKVPFRPSANKPIYCSRCFEKTEPRKFEPREQKSSVDMAPVTEQLSSINAKLDMLIDILSKKKAPKKV